MVPDPDRPRERLQAHGDGPLADAELLALVLGNSSTAVAHGLLARFPDLKRMATAGIGELRSVDGVGLAQACRLKAALALASRVGERRFIRGDAVAGPDDVWKRMAPRLMHLEREVFVGLALDSKNRVLCEMRLAEGGACSIEILPRDIFTRIVREAANGVIFIHNHPSGDPEPSPDDRALAHRLDQAGKLVGVRVLDHVIIADEGYRSASSGWA